jgi:hypothetical protein
MGIEVLPVYLTSAGVLQKLAEAFKVHPAIIMFPEYEAKEILKAA